MSYEVSVETFPQFLVDFSQKLHKGKKFFVEVYDEDGLYLNSEEYNRGKTNETISGKAFISELKEKYAYPQA
ncbi:MAG: hypothetical protein CR971_00760 [candidate division SR1 bacterium]|nr:MAG: hypothetical protein CR971_00760 [candidate division SR1 bacterium]